MLGIILSGLIPIGFSIMLFILFRKEVTWWEHALLYIASAILIIGFSFTGQWAGTQEREYYGSIIEEARDYEDWNEYIHRTCTEEYKCGTDDDGNDIMCERDYDCSYVDYHPQYYIAYTDIGSSFRLNAAEYNHVKEQLGGERVFVNMRRNYHTDDGDMYKTIFNEGTDSYCPATTTHCYSNRIKNSNVTIFNMKEVSDEQIEEYGLFDYPSAKSEVFFPSVTGYTLPKTNTELGELNGRYGSELQIRVFLWV